ncbi:hypothetical protein POREN0001_1112 [Porphyromonas endodontalis ATCC 35406]|uniref:Uncharacterized protein n=1 Tax=Porphyromonas endodontalis (strain ATCC 35406 / DSM 24491 / JCM 8526 / CCUG 16442 / BCRC 14492 / NCTC 13058 / HG 370) TaxID=553175 RepID=C3J9G8_POREA|nr:hypothetical protein POREN0001_1112 [Porphyromonas endodontalis ATCC 35406]
MICTSSIHNKTLHIPATELYTSSEPRFMPLAQAKLNDGINAIRQRSLIIGFTKRKHPNTTLNFEEPMITTSIAVKYGLVTRFIGSCYFLLSLCTKR